MSVDRTRMRWNGWGWAAHKDIVAPREELWTWLAAELGMPALLATPARPLEELTLPASKLSAPDRTALNAIVGEENVRETAFERAFHALGRSYHDLLRLRAGDLSTAPDAVVYPRGTEEVLAVLALAAKQRIAVVPFGGGTSAVGGVSGTRGPFDTVITLDMSAMNRLIDIDPVSRTATAEAGINGPALEKALREKGFTLGHMPDSFEFSTLGGWIAQRDAGATDWLVVAKLATPRGLLSTGDFPASAAGVQMKDIVAGSEGMFGVITEAVVRLHKLPQMSDCRAWLFRDFESGAAAIRTAMQEGIACSTLFLSDAEETRFQRASHTLGKTPGIVQWLVAKYFKLRGYDKLPCKLAAVFEGDERIASFERDRFRAVARKHGALSLGRGAGEQWRKTRFQAPYFRDTLLDRGVGIDMVETAASWSKLEALHAGVQAALEAAIREAVPREGARGLVMCRMAHASPQGASLCFTVVFPRLLDGDIEQWRRIKNAAVEAVLANGGTLSHHLGVGQDHLPWIAQEKGQLGIDVLRAVKAALDPEGILNPGKLLP